MTDDISRILIDEHEIHQQIDRLAEDIINDLNGEPFVVILLLKGALVFAADLCRRMPVPLEIECLNVASYHGGTESSGCVDFLDRTLPDVTGRNLLIVDDILDSGRTLAAVTAEFQTLGAKKIQSCVLLSKSKQRSVAAEADYVGFTIDDEFVVGYGLDFQGKYRNLPFIGVLKDNIISELS